MKMLIISFFSFLVLGFFMPNSINEKQHSIYIYLASGFDNDTISMEIENIKVLSNEIVNSKKDYNDLTNIYIEIKDDSIFLNKNGLIVLKEIINEYSKFFKIIITINNHPYSYTMNLREGKFLFISKHNYFYNVYFNQFKKPPLIY